MANKARWVFGVYKHRVFGITVRLGETEASALTENLSQLPRQDLRRACANVGLSGDASLTNAEMVNSLVDLSDHFTIPEGETSVKMCRRVVKNTSSTGVPVPPLSVPSVSTPTVQPSAPTVGGIEAMLDEMVKAACAEALLHYKPTLDANEIKDLVTDTVNGIVSRPIINNIVVNGSQVASTTGRRHHQYGDVMEHILLGDILYLWGGAGAGKTTVIAQIAKDLGKRFELVTFSAQTTEAKLVGFRDATGEVRETPLVEALQMPSIILMDEWDACPPSVAITVNAITANRMISTPSGTYEVHPEAVVVFSGNTNLDGATTAYNGRSATDFSSKDRVSVVEFLYDLDMERDLTVSALDGDVVKADQWLRIVRKARANILALGPTTSARIAVTPRAAISGATLLRSGRFDFKYVANARLRKGIDDRTWDSVRQGIPELA